MSDNFLTHKPGIVRITQFLSVTQADVGYQYILVGLMFLVKFGCVFFPAHTAEQ